MPIANPICRYPFQVRKRRLHSWEKCRDGGGDSQIRWEYRYNGVLLLCFPQISRILFEIGNRRSAIPTPNGRLHESKVHYSLQGYAIYSANHMFFRLLFCSERSKRHTTAAPAKRFSRPTSSSYLHNLGGQYRTSAAADFNSRPPCERPRPSTDEGMKSACPKVDYSAIQRATVPTLFLFVIC